MGPDTASDEDRVWDDVIVGAGSSGAVLAGRLSEDPDRQVLLLEAGADADPMGIDHVLGRPVLAGANWDHVAEVDDGARPRRYPYLVGKTVGGSSAVNGAIALRGFASDFDGWGIPEWAWDRVEPFFDGLIPVETMARERLGATAAAFLRASVASGLPELSDLNGMPRRGVGIVPANAVAGRRISAADAYLGPGRHRSNLTVRGGCEVIRVLLEGGDVTGVEVAVDGRRAHIAAGNVTLCCGAIGTPLVLERSGIGQADRLAALGIRPLVKLTGVGENLVDHPIVPIWMTAQPDACAPNEPWHQVMARIATAGPRPDVSLLLVGNVSGAAIPMAGAVLGRHTGISISVMALAPASRGSAHLSDAISLRLASKPADVDRLSAGTRTAWAIARSAGFARLTRGVLVWTERMIGEDALLRKSVSRFTVPAWHPAGTAKLGPDTDETAVVDEHFRVYGVDGLRVVDASVLPALPSAPTNLTCMMLAERAARWMR